MYNKDRFHAPGVLPVKVAVTRRLLSSWHSTVTCGQARLLWLLCVAPTTPTTTPANPTICDNNDAGYGTCRRSSEFHFSHDRTTTDNKKVAVKRVALVTVECEKSKKKKIKNRK